MKDQQWKTKVQLNLKSEKLIWPFLKSGQEESTMDAHRWNVHGDTMTNIKRITKKKHRTKNQHQCIKKIKNTSNDNQKIIIKKSSLDLVQSQ